MQKPLSIILGIAIFAFIAFKVMYGGRASVEQDRAKAVEQRLENVQNAADRIEDLQQKSAQDALDKAQE